MASKVKIERRDYKDMPLEVRHNISRLIVAMRNAFPESDGIQITIEHFVEKPPTLDLKMKVKKP